MDRPATVFLSYAHEDTEFVKDLQLRLNVRGVRSWRDGDDLMSGSPFEDEIVHAIECEVDAVALFLGLMPGYHVRLEFPEPSRDSVKDAAHALAIARQVGSVCQRLCDRQRVAHIHLFAAIPAELAVLIGHQLNALCPITLYEFDRIYRLVGTIQ